MAQYWSTLILPENLTSARYRIQSPFEDVEIYFQFSNFTKVSRQMMLAKDVTFDHISPCLPLFNQIVDFRQFDSL